MIKQLLLPFWVALFLTLQACSEGNLSPQDEIRQYIDRGIQRAEDRNAGDLIDMAHDSYEDEKGMNKTQLGKMLRLYFFRHKNIHLFKKIDQIILHGANEATVKLYVAMAGTVISDASMLSSLRARVYEFELQLIKQDDWLLRYAKWRPANLSAIE